MTGLGTMAPPIHFISKLNCSLVGKTQELHLLSKSKTHKAYGKDTTTEQFQCNYGLNEKFRDRLRDGELKVVGLDNDGTVRIVEISNHPFFIATLFLPQLSSRPGRVHPLINAFVKSAIGH